MAVLVAVAAQPVASPAGALSLTSSVKRPSLETPPPRARLVPVHWTSQERAARPGMSWRWTRYS